MAYISIPWFLLGILTVPLVADGYKVLVLFPFPSKSHSILGEGVVRQLLAAGHEVTLVTPYVKNDTQNNFRQVDVSSATNIISQDKINMKSFLDNQGMSGTPTSVFFIALEVVKDIFSNPNLVALISDPSERFDLVIGEYMMTELYPALGYVFNCPYVWFFPFEYNTLAMAILDQEPNPSYTPNFLITPPFNFVQRLQSLGLQVMTLILRNQVFSRYEEELFQKHIVPAAQKRRVDLPSYVEARDNVSLILANTHVSFGQTLTAPLNYVRIGGYHIKNEVEPLPDKLQKVLDNAKHGVIYFSMGSNLRSKDIPEKMKRELLNTFGSLKQVVLWKLEEPLSDLPKNVHILEWAPQPSILNHPNCVLFITHGGLLSTTETIHFGVPIIGIPVFADQFANVDKAVAKGYAKKVDLTYSLAADLKPTIEDILSDPKYSKRAKQLSQIYHDRPVSPGNELVHWVEHVIRTGGAPHLRSHALMLHWYQKYYLDALLLLFIILYAITFIVKRLLSKKPKVDIKKKKNK